MHRSYISLFQESVREYAELHNISINQVMISENRELQTQFRQNLTTSLGLESDLKLLSQLFDIDKEKGTLLFRINTQGHHIRVDLTHKKVPTKGPGEQHHLRAMRHIPWLNAHLTATPEAKRASKGHKSKAAWLCVGSCVELASDWGGWTTKDIECFDDGEWDIEKDVSAHLLRAKEQYGAEKKVDYALKSFVHPISDKKYIGEPSLKLRLRTIGHDLVRAVSRQFGAIYWNNPKRPNLLYAHDIKYPHAMAVHMATVCPGDNQDYLIVCQKTEHSWVYQYCWTTSFEEHLRSDDKSDDRPSPFQTVLRGLSEELTAETNCPPEKRNQPKSTHAIKLFCLFRELDRWKLQGEIDQNWINYVTLSGLVRIPLHVDEVLERWTRSEDGKAEFRDVVAVPYTFENVYRLVESETFDPLTFPGLKRTIGPEEDFRALHGGGLTQQHPTNKVRLIGCLLHDFLDELEAKRPSKE